MGFEVPDTLITLKFADPSFDGLEVKCKLVPLAQVTEAASLANVDPNRLNNEDLAKVERLVAAFASALVEWNLTRKGKKVPATMSGVKSLDIVFTMQLVEAWLSAMGKIIADQATASRDNAEVEESLPVESL